MACQCRGYTPETEERMDLFSIAAISNNNSVLLLKGSEYFSEDL